MCVKDITESTSHLFLLSQFRVKEGPYYKVASMIWFGDIIIPLSTSVYVGMSALGAASGMLTDIEQYWPEKEGKAHFLNSAR